jgi:hypothetical protein
MRHSRPQNYFDVSSHCDRRRAILPLPEGEGTALVRSQILDGLLRVLLVVFLFQIALPQIARAQPGLTQGRIDQMLRAQAPMDLSAPSSAEAWFDPPAVRPGDRSTFRVRIGALEASTHWPEGFTPPAGLTFRRGAQGQIMVAQSGAFRPLTIFNCEVRATNVGVFVIPAFTLTVYDKPVQVPETRLEVRTDLPQPAQPRHLITEPSKTNVFVGERIDVQVMSPASVSNTVEMVSQVQINGDGFLVDRNTARQTIQTVDISGRKVASFVYQTSITPITTGELNLSSQGFTGGRNLDQPVVITAPAMIPGVTTEYLLLESDVVTVHVRPLPAAGKLPGFAGAIGNFTRYPPELSTNTVHVGDPLQLTFVVRDESGAPLIVAPEPPRSADWQIMLSGPKQGVFVALPEIRSGIVTSGPVIGSSFTYTLIPRSAGATTTPAIPFSTFDPKNEKYVDLTVPSMPVRVLPGETPAENELPADAAYAGEAAPEEPVLSSLTESPGRSVATLVPLQLRARFWLVQLVPTFVLGSLWIWDRRRRYLERHPETVRCRAARRELRREKRRLRRAASQRDAPAFTQSAVRALKIACAPHYPAEPRALVCGDVLQLLDNDRRQGRAGEIVRRFFQAADASSFAGKVPVNGDLLSLEPDLSDVLSTLEERL